MSYPKSRLLEALQVIKEDDQRRKTLEAEKVARTQYRDSFHLRKTSNVHSQPDSFWQDDDSSDDDYDPSAKKRKRKSAKDNEYEADSEGCTKKAKSKRLKKASGTNIESRQGVDPVTTRTRTDTETDAVESESPFHAYLTLKLISQEGIQLLKLYQKKHPGTHIRVYLQRRNAAFNAEGSAYRAIGGDVTRSDRSAKELHHDYETALFVAENRELDVGEMDLPSPRKLRSGRVRAELIAKKRKKPSCELEAESALDEVENANDQIIKKLCVADTESNQKDASEKSTDKVIESRLHSEIQPSPPANTAPNEPIIIDSSSDSSHTLSPKPPPSQNLTRNLNSPNATTQPSLQRTASFSPNTTTISNTATTQPSQILILTTHFSHPITFKSPNPSTCTFHNDYRHPILGHGRTTGEYLVYTNQPSQWIEIDSGHRSRDIPADKMCISCAFNYMAIPRCTTHLFKPLRHSKAETAALGDGGARYVQDLYDTARKNQSNTNTKSNFGSSSANQEPSKRNTKALVRTCSFCVAPATYQCAKPQEKDRLLRPCMCPGETVDDARSRLQRARTPAQIRRSAEPQIQPPLFGCGLVLCSQCHVLVANRCSGQLESNRRLVLQTLRDRPLGPRADVGFLFMEGLVWKAFHVDRE